MIKSNVILPSPGAVTPNGIPADERYRSRKWTATKLLYWGGLYVIHFLLGVFSAMQWGGKLPDALYGELVFWSLGFLALIWTTVGVAYGIINVAEKGWAGWLKLKNGNSG